MRRWSRKEKVNKERVRVMGNVKFE